jgi:probable F420-dependent oxidoreductase
MKLGVVFPQLEIGHDPTVIRDFAQTVEGLGYEYLLAYDHVVGANPDRPGGFRGPYTHESTFHEPLVLFGYLAGLTTRIELWTGVIILPQRQTVLVAKQAAQVQVLSEGRLVLGVGVGWNDIEYEALGENFHDRGRRIEEQVALLRELWKKNAISFEGRYHRVSRAGLNPLPRARIPIWMGGTSDAVLERIGRLADGWLLQANLREKEGGVAPHFERIREAAERADRDPASIQFAVQMPVTRMSTAEQIERAREWSEAGCSHVGLVTMGAGFDSPGAHLDAVRAFKEAWV